jgi:Zn-dependent protease with chaperone function
MGEPIAAWHYDGQSAVRHDVHVALEGSALRFVESGETVPLSALRPVGDAKSAGFAHADREGWRLRFPDPLPPDWATALPGQERHGGIIDRFGVLPALIGCAVAAAIAVYAVAQSTSLIARLIPERWEAGFGEALTGDFGGKACSGAGGQQALDSLASRLAIDGKPVRVRVIDLGMVNAAALPGRQIVIFKGLLEQARSPDEVAGVLGHEIGHVEHRDPMTALIRDFGLGLLIGSAEGGRIAQGLLSSRYSRAAERDADIYSIEGMARARISPAATAGFFDRMGKDEAKLGTAAKMMSYMASHPLSTERKARFAASERKDVTYRPALNAEEWKALRAICKG